jgi:hypothetical protein
VPNGVPMTGFAGSRSVDERRRRRLASESDAVSLEAVAEPVPRRASPAKAKRKRRVTSHFPLRKVISIRYWKLAALLIGATAAAAGILVGGWAAATHAEQLGPGFVFLFRLDAARLVRGFAAVGLLLAGQLALLIGWARSQSLQDFNGRYRGWMLCALLAFVAACGIQAQLAAALSATAGWLWPDQLAHQATLLWLVPAASCGIFVHAYCVREMRDCRVSLAFAWLTFVLGGATAALLLGRPLPFPVWQARLIECAAAVLFVISAFASVLFHARHVVYICVDPPAIRPSRTLALLRRLSPGALFKFKRAGGGKNGKSADRETITSLKRRTPKRSRPLRRKASEPQPEPPEEEVVAPTARVRVEPAADDDDRASSAESVGGADSSAHGMSRRERRLLKKQLRAERTPLRRSA